MDTTFIDELASAAPTPGGGGAASYVGAVASALASMVGNLTVGKKTYAAVEDDVRARLDALEHLRDKLLALIESDAQAFEPLAASYRMPKATPEEAAAKQAALQLALGPACDVPLIIMRTCAEVIDHADFLARNGSKLAVSDAGAAAVLARAAVVAASMNVYINAASMDDEARADRYRAEADRLIAEANEPTEFSPTPWTRYGNIASFTTRTRKADMAELLKGKPVVDSMALDLRARIEALGRAKVVPALALVRVGQRPDDLSYERTARKRAESLGIAIRPYELDEFAPQAAIEAAIHEVNRDENVHGCLLFRPLPSFVDESHVCELLDPKKDIDGITLASLASVFTDGHAGYPPATAAACIQLLDHYQVPLQGKHVVVVGRSLVVGKPVSMMLLRRNASVTICHSKTENLADIMCSADVVICATGRARTFGAQFFGPGQTVLDVGINFDTQGNLCGDVDFAEVEPVVAAITPVPGGIGTVTTSVTMAHTVAAAEAALAARTGRR